MTGPGRRFTRPQIANSCTGPAGALRQPCQVPRDGPGSSGLPVSPQGSRTGAPSPQEPHARHQPSPSGAMWAYLPRPAAIVDDGLPTLIISNQPTPCTPALQRDLLTGTRARCETSFESRWSTAWFSSLHRFIHGKLQSDGHAQQAEAPTAVLLLEEQRHFEVPSSLDARPPHLSIRLKLP